MAQPSSHATPITHARNTWRMKMAAGVIACSLAFGSSVSVAYGAEGASYTLPDVSSQSAQSAQSDQPIQSATNDEKIPVDEMADASTFRGYAPALGYDFLRETIAKCDFAARGAA